MLVPDAELPNEGVIPDAWAPKRQKPTALRAQLVRKGELSGQEASELSSEEKLPRSQLCSMESGLSSTPAGEKCLLQYSDAQ